MIEPKVEILGADETVSALKQLGERIANDAAAAGKVAELAASGARDIAPFVTGELASGYGVQDRYIVNPVPYALYVEYGTENMDAQYPVKRTLEAIEGQAVDIYSQWSQEQIAGAGFDATG